MIQQQNYFSVFGFRMKNELSEIYLSEFFRMLGGTFINLFTPIYIYQNLGLKFVFLYILIGRIVAFFSSILSAELTARFGIRPIITLGAFLHIPFYYSLFMIEKSEIFIWYSAIFYGLHCAIYWIPANTNISMNVCENSTNQKMFIFKILGVIVGILTPLLSGIIISKFGYGSAFSIAIFFTTIFFILTFLLGEKFNKHNFESIKTIKKTFLDIFISDATRMNIVEGFRGVIVGRIWPIFIFISLGNVEKVGWMGSLATFTLLILSFKIAKIIDENPEKSKKFLQAGGVIEGISWISKLSAFNFYTLFFADTITNLSREFVANSIQKLNFGKMENSENKKALKNMTQRELAICIGGILGSIIMLLILYFLNDLWTLKIGLIFLGLISIVISSIPNKKISKN